LGGPIEWSPDGSKIVLTDWVEISPGLSRRAPTLVVVDRTGNLIQGGEKELTDRWFVHTLTDWKWSPDSKYLAIGSYFSLRGDGDLIVAIFEDDKLIIESKLSERFGDILEKEVMGITWSPEGEEILFVLSEFGNITDFGDIYITDVTLTDKILISTPESQTCGRPQWSLDGTRIIYQCKRTRTNSDIWIVHKDGTDMQPLLNSSAYEGDAVWQPIAR
jgi:Tol biopolymer transport system component